MNLQLVLSFVLAPKVDILSLMTATTHSVLALSWAWIAAACVGAPAGMMCLSPVLEILAWEFLICMAASSAIITVRSSLSADLSAPYLSFPLSCDLRMEEIYALVSPHFLVELLETSGLPANASR